METTEFSKSQFSSSDCSLNSLDTDSENEFMQFVYADELPAFEINSLSASPIQIEAKENENNENSCIITNCSINIINNLIPFRVTDDMISLSEINSQIEKNDDPSELKNLETIFEGVFLETPPKIKKYKDEIVYPKKYSAQKSKTISLINTTKTDQND